MASLFSRRRCTSTLPLMAIVLGILGGSIGITASTQAHNGIDHSKKPPHNPSVSEAPEHERPFLEKNAAAMKKMMADMNVQPTGDIDRDFVVMMVPHHQGAIDMCIAFLPYAKNPQLIRLCQEIIVTQQQEIAAMYLAIDMELPPSVSTPTQ